MMPASVDPHIQGWYPGFLDGGADSSNEGTNIVLKGYYKLKKSPNIPTEASMLRHHAYSLLWINKTTANKLINNQINKKSARKCKCASIAKIHSSRIPP